jgi:hypothetical protein
MIAQPAAALIFILLILGVLFFGAVVYVLTGPEE